MTDVPANPFLAPALPPTPAQHRPDGSRRHQACVYASVMGYRALELDVWVPRGEGPFPVVVWVHGGAFLFGSRTLLPGALRPDQLFEELLAAGLAVATVDYRHSREAVFPAQVHDVQAAVRWVRHHATALRLDPTRVALAGESAGGHLAALVGLAGDLPGLAGTTGILGPSTAVTTVVDWYGISDLSRMPAEMPVPADVAALLPPEDLVPPLEVLLDGVDAGTRALASPLAHVSPGGPSVLLVHGTADTTVPHEQSVWLHEALAAVGCEARLVSVPGAGHGFDGHPDVDGLVALTVDHLHAALTGPSSRS